MEEMWRKCGGELESNGGNVEENWSQMEERGQKWSKLAGNRHVLSVASP